MAAKAANPVQFKTIDRKMELPEGTVAGWSGIDGFPLAAEGVALESDVREFAVRVGLWSAEDGVVAEAVAAVVPPQNPQTEPEPVAPPEVENVVWVEIRVPVSVAAGKAPRIAHAPMTGFRFGSGDYDRLAREAMGRVLEGCRNSHVMRADGTHVDKLGHSLKWILDQVAAQIPAI